MTTRRRNGETDDVIAEILDVGGTGEQQVFNRRRLEGAIVGEAEDEIGCRRPGDRQARTQRLFGDEEVLAIPSQPGAERPRTATDAILHEQRLFAIHASAAEIEGTRQVVVERVRVGDVE